MYKRNIKDNKAVNRFLGLESACVAGWRVALVVAALCVVGGPAMASFGGQEMVGTIGEVLAMTSIPTFAAGLFGMIIADCADENAIKDNYIASKTAREENRKFRKEIQEIKRKPVMRKR